MNAFLPARAFAAPGLLALLYLCLCFAPLGSGLPFSVVSLRLWALAIAVLLAAALGQLLAPWRGARWLLALGLAGHCLGSPVLFPELTFHLLALSSGLLLILAVAASQAGRRIEGGLWLLSALLSWRYMQPHNLADTDALAAAMGAYGLPLLVISLAAHLALLAGFGQGLARSLNRAFVLALCVLLFTHATGLLPLGNPRQWLWLAAMSLVIDALVIAELLGQPGRLPKLLAWTLAGVLMLQGWPFAEHSAYRLSRAPGVYEWLASLPPSNILVQGWAAAAVSRYRELDPALARHRFFTDTADPGPASTAYLLGPPLDLAHNPSGLDAPLQQQVDRHRCRYTWQAAITDAGVLRLSCG